MSVRLKFDSAKGVGFSPFIKSPEYGEDYFERYRLMGRSAFGVALNSLRAGLVSRYLSPDDSLVDIGVGDGAFIRARGSAATSGYDINLVAVRMLVALDCWCDVLSRDTLDSVSFWDSLEHIQNPEMIINKVSKYCFVSLPVFSGLDHIMNSKHYRPDEHCWYFTRHGLISWFWDFGFVCHEMNECESTLGREDIGTFVFRRK